LIVDSNKALASYTVDGQKDPITRCIDTRSSLRHLVANCTDFKHEETAIQLLGAQLGVTVLLTPKFYAKLAGEGVEYCWAHAKSHYRCMSVSSKRGREYFKLLVKDCTSSVDMLTKVRVQKFASRARAYICTCHNLEQQVASTSAEALVAQKLELLYTQIELLMKDFKVHRCALDFDHGFVNSELKHEATRTDNH
jgi:hypothetical protein